MSSENSPSSRSPKEEPPNGSCFFNSSDGLEFDPYLVILEQPQSRFRFRYKSEMTGTHGSLMGESQDKTRKTYPTVKLNGFNDQQAIIRCSLATNESVPLPHVHSLEGDPQGEGADFQDVTVSSLNDYTASFQGITIIHTGKKHVKEVFERRLRHMYLQEALMTDPKIESLSSQSLQQIKEIAESKANSIDLHAVRLKFEALLPSETPGVFHYVCPPIYSNPVCNLKATQTGDLRIVRIDKHVSCVTGNEEVFIFVEKVNKRNIKVKFFEVDEETGSEVWHAFAEFSELDVHHQYAIAFKTPPYKDLDIDSDVDVYLQLYRPQDGATSDPKPFKYKPRDQPRKRARLGVGANESVDSFNHTGSFRTSSQSSVIVSPPSSQSLNKYGSGSSDSTSDSPYVSQLRALYGLQVPTPSRGFPVSQSAVAQKSLQQDTQQLYSTQPGRLYHSLQPVTHQASVANLTPVTSGIVMQPNIQSLPNLPPASEGLSLEIEDYLRRIEEQSINPTQVVTKHLQDGSVFSSIPPRVTSVRSVAPQGNFPPSQIGQGLSTVNMEHFLNGRSDPEGLPPNLSDNCNLACDGFANGYLAVTRGMQSLQVGDAPPTEEKRIKDLDVAKLVGLSLGTSLRKFAVSGNIMPLMIKMNSLVALQDDYGDNALHAALTHYQKEAFKLLLGAVSHRPKPNDVVDATNLKQQTPLHIAVLTNNCEAVKSLLAVGADSDVPDNSGNTALHLAATDQSLAECLVELLNPKNRSSMNATIALERNNYTDGYCPLHLAVVNNWVAGVKMLLEAGADPNKKDYRLGKSPLHLAAEADSVDIVNLILKTKRANPNIQAYDGTTPLHVAVLKKNEEICIELLRAGADPHISSFVPVGDESYYEGTSDTEEEDSYVYTQTPLDLAEDIPEIFEILTNPPAIIEESAETVEDQVENVPEGDVLALTSSCSQNGRLDSGIDIDSSSSCLADTVERGPKDVLDADSIEQLASLFPSQSQNFARLMSDFDFQLFRPVLATKENPAKYLFSNLPVSLRSFRTKLSNLQLKEAVEIVDKCLN